MHYFTDKLKERNLRFRIRKVQGARRIYTRISTEKRDVKLQRKLLREANSSNNIQINKPIAKELRNFKELKIITLNINHLANKVIEITELLYMDNPDVLQLQETHRTEQSPRINWPGYDVIESFAYDERGFNGLITAVKTELYGLYTVNKIEENLIELTFNDIMKNKLTLINIYIPVDMKYKPYLHKIIKLLDTKRQIVIIGDWNTDKNQLKAELSNQRTQTYVMENKIPGSRRVQGILTQRMIDYSVSNAKYIVTNERHLEDWAVSDHIPVETILTWKNKEIQKEDTLYFDRQKLRDNAIKKKILNHKFTEERGMTPQSTVDKFYTELNELLKDIKILNKKTEAEHRPNKEIKALTIKRRETQEEAIKKIINKEIKQKVKETRKEQYNKFIMKGCEVLLNSNSRESWKWLKQVSGLNKITELNYPIRDKTTGIIEHSNQGKAQIFKEHLSKLAMKEKPMNKAAEIMIQHMRECQAQKLIARTNRLEAIQEQEKNKLAADEIILPIGRNIRIRSDKNTVNNSEPNSITLKNKVLKKRTKSSSKTIKTKKKATLAKKAKSNSISLLNPNKALVNTEQERQMNAQTGASNEFKVFDSFIKINNKAEIELIASKTINTSNAQKNIRNIDYGSKTTNLIVPNAKRIKIILKRSTTSNTSSTRIITGESTLNTEPVNIEKTILKANKNGLSLLNTPNFGNNSSYNNEYNPIILETKLANNSTSKIDSEANEPITQNQITDNSSNSSKLNQLKCSTPKEALKTIKRSKSKSNSLSKFNEITQSQLS
ncbi:hypothetical protein GINT2_002283 [Glugoides intestinalis]